MYAIKTKPEIDALDDASMLLSFGGELKALNDDGRIGGHLVLFGTPKDADSDGDFFTPETDFGRHIKSGLDLYYYHGLPSIKGKPNPLQGKPIGEVECKTDDAGLWIEGQIALRDSYEKEVFKAVKVGKQGLSSGAMPHLVRRERGPRGTYKVTHWPIGEASITPTPADKRTYVNAIKTMEWLKGQCLGEDAERSALLSALSSLSDMARWRLGDFLRDPQKSIAEKQTFAQGVYDELATIAGKLIVVLLEQPESEAASEVKTLLSQFAAGASPEAWIETCCRTASGLEQSVRRFTNVGPEKLKGLKSLRDSLSAFVAEHEPKPAIDIEAERRRVNELLSKFGAA